MFNPRADADTTIPLWKPITGVDGNEVTALNVPKGTDFILVTLTAHRDPEIWGQSPSLLTSWSVEKNTTGTDALEFKPERWLSPLPDAVGDAALPGVYFQLLPFGGGFKACMWVQFF
jgi:cytochrome P450